MLPFSLCNAHANISIGSMRSINLFESNAAGVTNFPVEGHCAMKNADETNEVQENALTAKKGKSEA